MAAHRFEQARGGTLGMDAEDLIQMARPGQPIENLRARLEGLIKKTENTGAHTDSYVRVIEALVTVVDISAEETFLEENEITRIMRHLVHQMTDKEKNTDFLTAALRSKRYADEHHILRHKTRIVKAVLSWFNTDECGDVLRLSWEHVLSILLLLQQPGARDLVANITESDSLLTSSLSALIQGGQKDAAPDCYMEMICLSARLLLPETTRLLLSRFKPTSITTVQDPPLLIQLYKDHSERLCWPSGECRKHDSIQQLLTKRSEDNKKDTRFEFAPNQSLPTDEIKNCTKALINILDVFDGYDLPTNDAFGYNLVDYVYGCYIKFPCSFEDGVTLLLKVCEYDSVTSYVLTGMYRYLLGHFVNYKLFPMDEYEQLMRNIAVNTKFDFWNDVWPFYAVGGLSTHGRVILLKTVDTLLHNGREPDMEMVRKVCMELLQNAVDIYDYKLYRRSVHEKTNLIRDSANKYPPGWPNHESDLLEKLVTIVRKFPYNDLLDDDKYTFAQAAARSCFVALTKLILRQPGCDPHNTDVLGNTVLYHICVHFPDDDAMQIINDKTLNWNFQHTNHAGQTVSDYVSPMAVYVCSDYIKGVVRRLTAEGVSPREARLSVTGNTSAVTPVNLPRRRLQWDINPTVTCPIAMTSSSREMIESLHTEFILGNVYQMNKAMKGKACIIAIPVFLTPNLANLLGYEQDRDRLINLWSQIGFDVYVPKYDRKYYLTAEEIGSAVQEFASLCETSDQCAVLCVLSHGGDGFIYGSDGNTVDTRELVHHLDNVSCVKMASKPKLIIIQACQGGDADLGLHVRADPGAAASLPPPSSPASTHLPIISDVLICAPSMPGFASFVQNDTDKGSVFLKAFVAKMAEFVHCKDMNYILTMVNKEVSSDVIKAYRQGTREIDDHKQMPYFLNCLTKLLYFFPCPGGRNGSDFPETNDQAETMATSSTP